MDSPKAANIYPRNQLEGKSNYTVPLHSTTKQRIEAEGDGRLLSDCTFYLLPGQVENTSVNYFVVCCLGPHLWVARSMRHEVQIQSEKQYTWSDVDVYFEGRLVRHNDASGETKEDGLLTPHSMSGSLSILNQRGSLMEV